MNNVFASMEDWGNKLNAFNQTRRSTRVQLVDGTGPLFPGRPRGVGHRHVDHRQLSGWKQQHVGADGFPLFLVRRRMTGDRGGLQVLLLLLMHLLLLLEVLCVLLLLLLLMMMVPCHNLLVAPDHWRPAWIWFGMHDLFVLRVHQHHVVMVVMHRFDPPGHVNDYPANNTWSVRVRSSTRFRPTGDVHVYRDTDRILKYYAIHANLWSVKVDPGEFFRKKKKIIK